ncbi:MAG: helix-turn-helix transcriptional regulator [Spirochaetes bacterium]|nr:helix-turn-helix transcriptional regulator [Spirochaetota bacterium]
MLFPFYYSFKLPLLTPYFFAIYLYGIFFAITRYKFLSFSLKEIAHEALIHVQDIILILDTEGTIIYSNGNLEKEISENPVLLKGRKFNSLIETESQFDTDFNSISSGEKSSITLRINFTTQHESLISESYISRVTDKFGDYSALLIVSRINKGIRQFQRYFKITERELNIIYQATKGLSNRDISSKLKISERTVETHLNNIYNKLNINNKIELLRMTSDFGIDISEFS